jgi:hypothetical protein
LTDFLEVLSERPFARLHGATFLKKIILMLSGWMIRIQFPAMAGFFFGTAFRSSPETIQLPTQMTYITADCFEHLLHILEVPGRNPDSETGYSDFCST